MKPILYVKAGCPWCVKALEFFRKEGVELDIRDVYQSRDDMERMIKISGQTKCPTLEFGDFIVADFSVDEFLDAVNKAPEARRKLGLEGK